MSKHAYVDLLSLKKRLADKEKSLVAQLDQVRKQLLSIETTLSLLDDESEPHSNVVTFIYPPENLRGLTHIQALERIAKANDGKLRIVDAKHVMIAARLITTPKNAYSIISSDILRSERFEKTAPGEFRLKEEKQFLAESASHK
jgi:hypothetical protein